MKTRCPRCHTPRNRGAHCQPCHNRQRREATRRLDDTAITFTITNRRATPGLRPHERRAISAQFTALNLPAKEIARILGVTPRTIHRWRARAREGEPAA
ncbi:helix-turn-helix domain-containing protein [Streptomyces sp. NPDC050439]|uniref:helix-turn-helix domain-containing protein n=1 Tax=unclassified Streptomyces TaxID=2593676 RepID=UPI003448B7F4